MADFNTRYIGIDWLGRGLSIVGLAVAGVALWQAYQKPVPGGTAFEKGGPVENYVDEQIQRKLAIELGTKFEGHEKRVSEFLANSDKQLVAGLNNFDEKSKQLIDTLIDHDKQDRNRRDQEFQALLANLNRSGTAPSTPSDTDQPAAESTSSTKSVLTNPLNADGAQPTIKLAELRLRPAAGVSTVMRLYNDGDAAAAITRVEFMPKKEFRVSKSAAESAARDDKLRIVVFEPVHNTATEKDAHATYRYELREPIALAANEELRLCLQIANSEYVGFGFRGPANLYYGDGQVVKVPEIQVLFRKSIVPEIDTSNNADL
jgi:hypothetical protein